MDQYLDAIRVRWPRAKLLGFRYFATKHNDQLLFMRVAINSKCVRFVYKLNGGSLTWKTITTPMRRKLVKGAVRWENLP